ncbi:bifunctional [glutamate--ammonia ligase]-adenylyl-L-tyrosine phosphorylase/[glutamate--ammonia-ligase] adenylyltransferase [Desulfomonile tiedjei]|uniref:Glutamine synthetase adenylyltransferase n=1 Tax=Desulfomonile tiedjei (strain ATCC 49306 / DSM 6799 / DCB-1) TaxID=706587 RepID=I4C8I3_DESTA|nr:bifunctional [glutamate--ammonia ligase]-adenylyl-L-tyrosine phosphorylase/[glutamate--ammonia-ligase] adenylyltransferase [Desulfomonile tiedjei]AFM25874.1 glutamine synthetase adenylyltransferase [Desulfomonile tiedjei DSM 6799]
MEINTLLTYIGRNCPALSCWLASLETDQSDRVCRDLLDTANPRIAVGRVEDLLGTDGGETVRTILRDERLRRVFLTTVGGSRFLFSILCRIPESLAPLFLQEGCSIRKTRAIMERELRETYEGLGNSKEFDRMLRVYKEREFLRIGCRDLNNLAEVEEVMAELSDLAAAGIESAIQFHWKRLTEKHGTPEGLEQGLGFVALGMGKISGRELNFSSDVDLIFIREPEEGRTQGPEPIPIAKFYESLAQSVSRSLSDVTEDGFVFRIDLRLRPEGEKGELVPSYTNALDYYLGWGRTWERAALMKAAPLAGDRKLGKDFLQELEQFVYRKHLDYSTLEEMRIMKLRIEAQLKKKPGVNIKLGQGGIREIEFFVQALQLINGGKQRRVRSASTLEALDLLRETGLLDKQTTDALRSAYRFFRKTEHRIQINHQLQTHELPRTPEDQEELARRLGYKEEPLKHFLADLDYHRRVVEELFSSMFHHSDEEILDRISPEAKRLIETIHDESVCKNLLEQLGFDDPLSAYAVLKNLVIPTDRKIPSEKARVLLSRLAPLFLDELLTVPEPEKALVALDRYIDSLFAHSSYFSTLLENPPTIRFIVKILGESRFFTDLLVRHPQAIDSLIARGAEEFPKSRETLESIVTERLAYSEDLEAEMDVLRTFKNEEILMIGVKHLAGEIDSPTARALVTELAEVCLCAAIDLAVKEMTRKFGEFDFLDPLPFVVLGMGKLGGREMTYLSDLDVIFIYECPEMQIGRFSTHEWFTRLANRIISILSVPTAEGTVFSIDTRLRPSGNKGPLVSSLDSFRDYHEATSQLWEKQALLRARPLSGGPDLVQQVNCIVRDCITRTRLSSDDVKEIARLRGRMETELALEDDLHVDLKTGHGGLVDVEFLVQAHILKHAYHFPEIIKNNTLEGLSALRDAGIIDECAFESLDFGYRWLSNLEDRLRIMEHRSIDRMPLTGEKLRGLALRLGYGEGGEDRLISDYFTITGTIRSIYRAFFGEPLARAPRT